MNIQSSPPVCVAACSIPGCGDATSDNLPPCTSCWRWTWSLFLPAATRSDDWRGRRSWKRATRRLVTMAKQLLWIMMGGRRRQFSLHDPWVEDYQEARGEGDRILSVTLALTHCWLAETKAHKWQWKSNLWLNPSSVNWLKTAQGFLLLWAAPLELWCHLTIAGQSMLQIL